MRFLRNPNLRRALSSSTSRSMASLPIFVIGKEGDPSLEPLKQLPEGAEVIGIGDSIEAADESILAQAKCVYASLMGKPHVTLKQMYSSFTSLEWVHSQTAGVDTIMFPEFVNDDKVKLTNAKGVYNRSLVEYVIFSMMYFAKDTPRLRRNQKAKVWDPFFIEEINSKTVGVVGYGEIGKDCAKKAKESFNMKTIALRRRPSLSGGDGIADEVYGSDQLHEMLGKCDYVLCATPLTPQTYHMFNAEAFKAMKPTAVFINIGRGPVCEEAALVDALKNGTIRGAVLDVFEKEPLDTSSELWGFENLLFSPHNADLTKECRIEATEHFVSLTKDFLQGESIDEFLCDKKAGY